MTSVRDALVPPTPATELPRDRVWRTGPHAIGDGELLALLLGPGPRDLRSIATAREIVRSAGGLAALSRSTPRELAQLAGVGAARATRIAAAFELGRRAVDLVRTRPSMAAAEDVYRCVASRLAGLAQEVFLVIGVDVRNGVLDIVECARGHASGVEIHPREVFRPLVRMAAAGGVLVHNHPSGDPTPSTEDVELTRRLRDIGQLMGIPIIDHVVIGEASYRSIAEWVGAEG
jgi:DNA repair protein RadC